jgi:hypothetical protein
MLTPFTNEEENNEERKSERQNAKYREKTNIHPKVFLMEPEQLEDYFSWDLQYM